MNDFQPTPWFTLSNWFTRIKETNKYGWDSISTIFQNEANFEPSLSEWRQQQNKILAPFLANKPDNLTDKVKVFHYLFSQASISQFYDWSNFETSYKDLFHMEVPPEISNCFISMESLDSCLKMIEKDDKVLFVNRANMVLWIIEYAQLYIAYYLICALSPAPNNRVKSSLDKMVREYDKTNTDYFSNSENIKLPIYKRYKTINHHWNMEHNQPISKILPLLKNLTAQKFNRIDHFYLPAIVKQIYFKSKAKDAPLYVVIMPLIALLKSMDPKLKKELYITAEAFENEQKEICFHSYSEYCSKTINNFIKTTDPIDSISIKNNQQNK
jgi:hypothetical protein